MVFLCSELSGSITGIDLPVDCGVLAESVPTYREVQDLNNNEEIFFWRVYNDFEKKIYERSSQKIRSIRKKYFKEIDSISSLEAYKAINQMNILEHLALELKKKRDLTLIDSLSPNKVLKVQHAEYRFKREMISKIVKKTNNEAEKK